MSNNKGKQMPKQWTAPRYIKVADTLRLEIHDGLYPAGALLDTESKLSKRFQVSRHTVREALRLLRDDGLVSSRRGSGTRVMSPLLRARDSHQVMSINDLVMFSDDTTFAIETSEVVKFKQEQASLLALEAGQEWLQISGLRYRKGERSPMGWSSYYIPHEYAHIARLIHRASGPVFVLMEDFTGYKVSEVQQQISASAMPIHLADSLRTDVSAAALIVRRTYLTEESKVLQVTLNIHPADRFQHAMTMRRVRKG